MESIAQHRHKANRLFNSLYEELPMKQRHKMKWMHYHLLRALALRGRQVRVARTQFKNSVKVLKILEAIDKGKE